MFFHENILKNPEKYKEMLMAIVNDALEILGYGSAERI
jgi:hypothetical protein